jgi:perosamine synthetase
VMIPYGRQSIDRADIEAVVAALEADLLTTGPRVEQFEAELCGVTGARFAVACSNGTTALHLACLALDVGSGDVGVTSPITFVASANCVEMCGGRATFVDITNSVGLDPNWLEDYCRKNPAPRVVIPVDYAGVTARLKEIHELSQKYGFKVIEDASHSIGSLYCDGEKWLSAGACVHSDVATLSFHPVKNITTGEGGAVVTNDETIARRLRMFRAHGIERDSHNMHTYDGGWYYEMQHLGYNYRITDIQCALGSSQLRKLAEIKERRKLITDRYNAAFSQVDGLSVPEWDEGVQPCYHLYPISLHAGPDVRRALYDYLKAHGILAQVHYIPVHLQPYYQQKYGFKQGDFPRSEQYYRSCLSLPLHCSLTDEEVDLVVERVKAFLEPDHCKVES